MRSADILKNVGVCNLQDRREQQLAILMFKIKNKMLPKYLAEIFTSTNSINDYITIREIANLISLYLILKQIA